MPTASTVLRDIDLPSSPYAEVIVRAIESAISVRSRSQFFIWSQNHLDTILPHQIAVCGAYERARKELGFSVFYAVPVPKALLASLSDGQSSLLRRVMALWVEGQGRSLILDTGTAGSAEHNCYDGLLQAGYRQLLVHGVARPQRPAELESIFLLTATGGVWTEQHLQFLDLLLPCLHATYLRVCATESDLAEKRPMAAVVPLVKRTSPITERERQILFWVREGMSNQQIGEQLNISALTVKNHVQKILRKLGAANRAQAVAMAISQKLMEASRT
jgi:transcriptional regulator EpsA